MPLSAKSLRILTVSLASASAGAGKGYSTDSVTHSRPWASKAMLIGLLILRLGGDQFDDEAGRQVKCLELLLRGQRRR